MVVPSELKKNGNDGSQSSSGFQKEDGCHSRRPLLRAKRPPHQATTRSPFPKPNLNVELRPSAANRNDGSKHVAFHNGSRRIFRVRCQNQASVVASPQPNPNVDLPSSASNETASKQVAFHNGSRRLVLAKRPPSLASAVATPQPDPNSTNGNQTVGNHIRPKNSIFKNGDVSSENVPPIMVRSLRSVRESSLSQIEKVTPVTLGEVGNGTDQSSGPFNQERNLPSTPHKVNFISHRHPSGKESCQPLSVATYFTNGQVPSQKVAFRNDQPLSRPEPDEELPQPSIPIRNSVPRQVPASDKREESNDVKAPQETRLQKYVAPERALVSAGRAEQNDKKVPATSALVCSEAPLQELASKRNVANVKSTDSGWLEMSTRLKRLAEDYEYKYLKIYFDMSQTSSLEEGIKLDEASILKEEEVIALSIKTAQWVLESTNKMSDETRNTIIKNCTFAEDYLGRASLCVSYIRSEMDTRKEKHPAHCHIDAFDTSNLQAALSSTTEQLPKSMLKDLPPYSKNPLPLSPPPEVASKLPPLPDNSDDDL